MIARIDLHIHTTYSDGLASPKEVIAAVRKKRLAAFAICDHDNFDGYFETKNLLRDGDAELIPGTELSSGQSGEDIHILGYFFDPSSRLLKNTLENFREKRNRRGEEMLLRLKKMGIDISLGMVREIAGDSAIGRPHIADAMVRVKAVRRYEDAFARYIGIKGPAYVPKSNLPPEGSIELIHSAGGLAFLAHPGIAGADRHIDEFIDYGLDGIEVYHPFHSESQWKTYLEIVEKRGLLACGGSDFHGRERHYGMIGSQPVPPEFLTNMKKRLNLK